MQYAICNANLRCHKYLLDGEDEGVTVGNEEGDDADDIKNDGVVVDQKQQKTYSMVQKH